MKVEVMLSKRRLSERNFEMLENIFWSREGLRVYRGHHPETVLSFRKESGGAFDVSRAYQLLTSQGYSFTYSKIDTDEKS